MVRVWEKIRPLAGSRGAGRPGTLRENARRARALGRLKRFLKFEFKRRLGLTASVNRFSSTGKTSNRD